MMCKTSTGEGIIFKTDHFQKFYTDGVGCMFAGPIVFYFTWKVSKMVSLMEQGLSVMKYTLCIKAPVISN